MRVCLCLKSNLALISVTPHTQTQLLKFSYAGNRELNHMGREKVQAEIKSLCKKKKIFSLIIECSCAPLVSQGLKQGHTSHLFINNGTHTRTVTYARTHTEIPVRQESNILLEIVGFTQMQ